MLVDLKVWDEADAISRLREPWQHLYDQCPDAPIFLSWEWVSTWWSHFHDGRTPHVVTLSDADRLVAVAPLMKANGGSPTLSFMQRDETTDYADVLAPPTFCADASDALLEYLEKACSAGGSARLEPVPEESPLLLAVDGGKSNLVGERIQPCPTVRLADTWDAYLGALTKKDRHELRRKIRRAETAGHLLHEVATARDALDLPLQEFYRLHQSSSDPKKAQFLDLHLQAFFSDAARILAERGWLRLSTLRLDGAAIASLLSFDRGSTVSLYNSGLDPEFRWLSPGIVIIAYELQAAIAAGRLTYDFLRGDEPYKYDFGARDRFVWRLRFETGPKLPNAQRGAALSANGTPQP